MDLLHFCEPEQGCGDARFTGLPDIMKRVVCAMSGGVDSSVTAVLLKEQGYEVIGISMKLAEPPADAAAKVSGCCSVKDFNDARSICASLEIPFYSMNFKEEFKEKVMNTFVREYLMGRTPNPCVLCNQDIKFDAFLAKAEELGADYVATGHYARIRQTPEGRYQLLRGTDPNKDQSYFLFSLKQKDLAKILFPVGDLTKPEVRDLAKKYNLKTKDKAESQEICFVPNDDPGAFIEQYVGAIHESPLQNRGDFVDLNGKVLGRHRGIHHYTIGQRRGIQVAMGSRYYVQHINSETNQIVLAEDQALYYDRLTASQASWVGYQPDENEWVQAKIRYRTQPESCQVRNIENNQIEVKFKEAQRAIAPGQAIVFYQGDEVLGGGWIDRVL